MSSNSTGWVPVGGDSADYPTEDYYKPEHHLGVMHLACGIEQRMAGEYPFLEKHMKRDDRTGQRVDYPVVRVRTLVVWKDGGGEPPAVYRGSMGAAGGSDDIVIPQRRLVSVLAAHAGELKPVVAWLEKPGQAYEFRRPSDDELAWVGRWMNEWFQERDGVAVCHYQPPAPGPAPSPGPAPAPPPAAEVDPGPVWEQPEHRQPTPPAAAATGNAAVDRERMEAPF